MGIEPTATSFQESITTIRRLLPDNLQNPHVGIICGSGLSGLVNNFRDVVFIPYEKIPGFVTSTGVFLCIRRDGKYCMTIHKSTQVPGHRSVLAFGFLASAGVPVVAMLGRVRKPWMPIN